MLSDWLAFAWLLTVSALKQFVSKQHAVLKTGDRYFSGMEINFNVLQPCLSKYLNLSEQFAVS